MEYQIRHRRLYAFYRSKVLNSLEIVIIVGLFMMAYYNDMLLPLACSALAFLFFIGYTLWFWIKKPKTITINGWLSNSTTPFALYFLIVCAIKHPADWWYALPVIGAVAVMFGALIKGDEKFDI